MILDFDETASTRVVERVDDDETRVGAENEQPHGKMETKMIESSMVFINEASTRPDNLSNVTELAATTTSSERRFLVRNSSKFTRDSDGSIYTKMFPQRVLFGRDQPGEERTVSVSQEACITYYSMHSSRHFAEKETFLLVAFDLLSTQNMIMQISLTCTRHPDLFGGYEAITH